MVKASPLVRSFNAGEFSPLMEGRTDVDRYPASNRQLSNAVAAPQGPFVPRSGTEFIQAVYDHAKKSSLLPFVFSETDMYMIEFADARLRFFTEDGGIVVYTPVSATMVSTSPFKFTSATLNAAVGDEVALFNWPTEYNLNSEVAKITAKVGDDYTIDKQHPSLAAAVGILVAKVYSIASPYLEVSLQSIRGLQSLDVIYLVDGKQAPYKLKRYDTYDWQFEIVPFTDGPYDIVNETATSLTPSITGRATADLTGNTSPAGYVAGGSSIFSGSQYWHAWDSLDDQSYWRSNTDQAGYITLEVPTAFVCDGYYIVGPNSSADISYTPKDLAPSTWTFSGSNDGSNWTVLDRQTTYVLYTKQRTAFFRLKNLVAYKYYQLDVRACVRNGPIQPYIKSLVLRSVASSSMTITASSVTGINNDAGFKTTDVGRFIRAKGSDGMWRSLKITARTNATTVTATLLDDPFPNLNAITEWRLGLWSNTTGWPNALSFYQDRLWFGGSTSYPDRVVGSETGKYESMSPSDADGVVVDTNSINVTLNSRRRSRIKWIQGSDKGLLAGTGSQEFVIAPGDGTDKALTPATAKAKESSFRGSSDAEQIAIDNAVLFLQRAGRTLREFAWVYEADGYKSPSMSMLASHMGKVPFEQIVYAAEPYSIVWLRNREGKLMGLTYNRDENVVGWHRHDFDGVVEWMAIMPASSGLQDTLWIVIRRTINGQQRRYIERLTRFWDFDMTLEDAHYVDCGLRYEGTPIQDVYGFQHLEARNDIYGLADGNPVGPFTVNQGKITLDSAASSIVMGIGFESLVETSRLENGAQDGTAIGKEKRIHNLAAIVWSSFAGEMGVWNEDENKIDWQPFEYPKDDYSQIEQEINLYSGIVGPTIQAPTYSKRGSIFLRRRKDKPLPLNVVALMPQLVTQDR